MARHPPGQLDTSGWLCPVSAGSPGGARPPPLTSWTRVVWQFLRSGPCSSTLGAPGCNESIGAGGWREAPRPPAPLLGPRLCLVPGSCPGLHPPAQHPSPPPAHPHRGPVDEPVRLLLAVNDDAVALPPLLGRPARAKAAGRCWHPACPGTRGCSIPSGSPGCSGAGPCLHSPKLLSCLHHHEVPRVVDPLVQEVVVVLWRVGMA